VEPVLQGLPADVTSEQRHQVIDFLQEFDDMFSRGTFDMGRTTLVEHTIDTGTCRPIRQPLRRHPRAHLEEIDQQVEELLQHGFIEPAASPWASNVVLVRKKDGSYRLCVDYRKLNSVTYKDSYPLPHIDTCLGSMNGAVWFSTLDLRSGYHNIPIREADRDKTAFITRRGCFRYKVMPFGLTCAPSVFQRLMDLVLCGLTYVTCLVYLDDIIVFGCDFGSHLERLREIFSRLRAANLKVHIKKCSLFQRRVNFLGHVLTKSGIEVQSEKVEAVENWPTPRNLTELRSFVGLCSYYRRFIAGFADLASPLHALTRKHARFRWGPEQEEAFNKLKERLTSAPILGMPRDDGVYYLDTDASDIGLGAVLSQEQDGQEVVLAYASKTLSRTERNYEVTRRELLAIVYGLKVYRQYLLGRRFVIRTDHSALQSLRRTPEPIGQQARWQSFIEQFDFEIRHRPGTRHQNADALSRRPGIEDEEEDSDEEVHRLRAVTSADQSRVKQGQALAGESMSKLQQNDPDIGPILRLRLQQSNQPRPEEVLSESEAAKVLWGQWHCLTVKDNVLYRKVGAKDGRPSLFQLIVPAARKTDFMSACHQGMTGGHRAFRSTLEQVRRRGFWSGWRRDVQRYCRQCPNCISYHRGHLPRSGPLQPMLTGNVLERCHVDITGPHPQTPRGSKYILTCVDAFSKWAEAFALPNREAKTVARVLVEQVFCRLGTPLALLTDNAGELDGRLIQEICQLLEIDKQRTSFYRPQTNSVAERFHATLNSMMGRMISDHQKEWDLLLPHIMAAYRASVHQSTGYTPNYLMFGREVRAPVDLVFETPTEDPPASYDDYTANLEDRKRQAYRLVREHLGVAAERMKKQYDLRVRPMKYHRGQWVLYFNPRKFQGRQQKWQRKFSPYLVIKELPPVNYLIQKTKRSRPLIAHVDKLKRWSTDNPPRSWLTGDRTDEGKKDHGRSADGNVVSGTIDPRNAGEQADDAGDVVLHVNDSGHSDGMVKIAEPGTISADVNEGTSLRVDGQEEPGLIDDGVDRGQHGPRDVVSIKDQGTSSGHVADEQRGPGTLADVVGNESALPRVDGQEDPSETPSHRHPGDEADVGRRADIRVDGQAFGGTDGIVLSKQHGQRGVGARPRRYTCGPTDGAWPRRYICGPTLGKRPRRYICGPTVGVRPRRYTFGHNEDDDARRPQTSTGSKKTQSNQHPTSDAGQSIERSRTRYGDPAIAGDPVSATQRVERPRRAIRQPGRLKDYVL